MNKAIKKHTNIKVVTGLIITIMFSISACTNNANINNTEPTNNQQISENQESTKTSDIPETQTTKEKLEVTTTFYPIAFFTKEIAGDTANITNLADGQDPHSFTPSPKDIVSIHESDLLIFNGAHLEPWVEDMESTFEENSIEYLELAQNINLNQNPENKTKTTNTEIEQNKDKDQHTHNHGDTDPHIWLDPVLAQKIVEEIKSELIKIDPDNSELFTKNANQLQEKLKELDQKYKNTLSNCTLEKAIISHDALGYISDRYEIQFLSISGISTQDEASAQTLAKLKQESENGIKYILSEEGAVQKFAETLSSETELEILSINTMGREKGDKTYFEISESNLENLKTAFECQ